MADTIEIKRLTVRDDRVVCQLVVPDESRRYTNEALAKRIAECFPDLPGHSCANARGKNFGAVMACTSLPHLLEHLVIDLQASALAQDDGRNSVKAFDQAFNQEFLQETTLVGMTRWTDKKQGQACVEVSFTDDLVVLRAFREASRIINEVMLQ